ncbi:hypothetical protein JCM10207_007065 [Rhodosporidiobolus poonsookiae]
MHERIERLGGTIDDGDGTSDSGSSSEPDENDDDSSSSSGPSDHAHSLIQTLSGRRTRLVDLPGPHELFPSYRDLLITLFAYAEQRNLTFEMARYSAHTTLRCITHGRSCPWRVTIGEEKEGAAALELCDEHDHPTISGLSIGSPAPTEQTSPAPPTWSPPAQSFSPSVLLPPEPPVPPSFPSSLFDASAAPIQNPLPAFLISLLPSASLSSIDNLAFFLYSAGVGSLDDLALLVCLGDDTLVAMLQRLVETSAAEVRGAEGLLQALRAAKVEVSQT